jgi:hypothetical protein
MRATTIHNSAICAEKPFTYEKDWNFLEFTQIAMRTEPTRSMPHLFLLGLSVVLLMIKIDATYTRYECQNFKLYLNQMGFWTKGFDSVLNVLWGTRGTHSIDDCAECSQSTRVVTDHDGERAEVAENLGDGVLHHPGYTLREYRTVWWDGLQAAGGTTKDEQRRPVVGETRQET